MSLQGWRSFQFFWEAGVETYLIERKLDNCKPCGGAIPLCMIDEFDLPKDIVDRQAGGDAFLGQPRQSNGAVPRFWHSFASPAASRFNGL